MGFQTLKDNEHPEVVHSALTVRPKQIGSLLEADRELASNVSICPGPPLPVIPVPAFSFSALDLGDGRQESTAPWPQPYGLVQSFSGLGGSAVWPV